MDAIERVAEIHRAGAKRIARPAAHEPWEIRLALDHLGGRMAVRPLLLARDRLQNRPGKTLSSDTDAVAHGTAVAEHEIEIRVRRVDHDGAGLLGCRIVHDLTAQVRR